MKGWFNMVLIGVLLVIVGFALKLDTIAVVIVSGIVTGLIAGLDIMKILEILGKAFVDSRNMTLFVLTLPVVGICERYGLKEKAIDFIKKSKALTTGKVLTLYLLIRELAAAFSVRLGGHPQFIRPLIHPMAHGASVGKYGAIDEEDEDKIKGASAAAENFGNFYGQNVFIGSAGVLLVAGALNKTKYVVKEVDLAKWAIPVAVITFVLVAVYNYILDSKLQKKYSKKTSNNIKV
jgi:uncharacterized membrane protein